MAANSLRDRLRLADGPVNLLGYPTDATPLAPGGKGRTARELERTGAELAQLQEMLFANGAEGSQRRVLLVLQGTDSSGKDGVIRHVVGQVGPAGLKITAFKQPTPAEAAHHFLWRIRRALPEAGMIGVFNRSHYEDVLVTKVHGLVDEPTWEQRIAEINEFETDLTDVSTVVVKCFLHISYAEQRRRLRARLDDPTKLWKFNPKDLDERARWSDYQSTYAEVLGHTSTEVAPWYVIPSDRKWYRNWAVGRLLDETLRDFDLRYPPADFDVEANRARLAPPF
jgi:PPK2 family polyphosphate:nucleotide phosphotransferase